VNLFAGYLDLSYKFEFSVWWKVSIKQVVPQEITIEDKITSEQVRLIAELDEKDKSIIFGLIETMLTKKKFKDFFNKNVAMLIE
jgi:hypothetical protein